MASPSKVDLHLFVSYARAIAVAGELQAVGVPSSDISVIARRREHGDDEASLAANATVGIGVSAGVGHLGCPAIMVVSDVGPVVGSGWLASAAASAASGSIVGALMDNGVSEQYAEIYAEAVRRGRTLIAVRTESIPRSTIGSVIGRYEANNLPDIDKPIDHIDRTKVVDASSDRH